MHGGSVEAHSEGEGRGATFTVKLPTPATHVETSLTSDNGKAGHQSSLNLRGVKVLAVDDSSDTRQLVSVVLEHCGALVTTASSVREALDIFDSWKADVIICDIGMPEQDGYAFIRTIRQLPPEQGGDTPAIALTGYARVEDRLQALRAGYQMFVPKPIEATELCTIVANLINGNTHHGT